MRARICDRTPAGKPDDGASCEVGGDYQVSFVAENLAKSGSLKKNWGAWTIKKTRRSIRPK